MNNNRTSHVITIGLLIFTLIFSGMSYATTAAGTLIQNQASATYKDAAGVEQFSTSNVVATLIQQVGAMTLVEDQSRLGVVGHIVYLPHVLTNTGNGVDTYDLTVTNVAGDSYDFDLAKVLFYADKNKDGLSDNTTPITSTGALDADEAFYFVVGAEIPAGQANGDVGKLEIKGKSTFVESPTDLVIEETNTDTITVSDKAVIHVIKSMNEHSGASPSGAYTVTLSYKNTSAIAATEVTLIDILPTGMSYHSDGGNNHAVWSVGAVTLTDVNEDIQEAGITYCAYDASCSTGSFSDNQVTAVIASVPAGASGTVSFKVMIDSGLSAKELVNIAEFNYNDGGAAIPLAETNRVPFEITKELGVVANGSISDPVDPADNVDNKGTGTDAFIVDTATRGETVVFDNMIHNTGNVNDVFDITIDESGSTFPAGTIFQLYQEDGFTPLMDTNHNGVVDTGIIVPEGSYKVVLKAILPVNAATGNNAAAGFKVTKTATSSIDRNISNSVIDHLVAITGDSTVLGSSVDLTNHAAIGGAGVVGVGAGPEANAVTIENIVPSGQVIFKLFVNNTSSASNSYELQYSSTNFNASVVEAGWKIVIHPDGGNGDCSTLGSATSVTKNIAKNASQLMCAVVTAPADAVADANEHPIYFKVHSRLTGAKDIKYDAVLVTELPELSISPDQLGQVVPGSMVVYSHHINNNGNTNLECINVVSTDHDATSGWSSVIYKDVNEDGKLDAGDIPLTHQTLTAGTGFSILIKLFSPATAPMGMKNMQTLVVTGYKENADADGNPATCANAGGLTAQVQDVTTVNASKVSIIKEQAVDQACDGTEDVAFSTKTFEVDPGSCVIYRLTATNKGAVPVNNVRIDDAAPTFTVFKHAGGLPKVTQGGLEGGVDGGEENITGGSVGGTSITLQSGETMILTFEVKLVN